MTNTQWNRIGWIRFAVGLMIGLCSGFLYAQSGPCEYVQSTDRLHCYVGAVADTDRVFVDTTSSQSPDADIGYPFDETGSNPSIVYAVSQVRYVDPRDVGEDRVTGWLDLSAPNGKILVNGQWVDDPALRVIIHVTANVLGLCNVAACGSRLVMSRAAKNTIVRAPVNSKRRGVTP